MTKTAFITGITGQDGVYLATLLLGKGYDVHGLRLYEVAPDTSALDALATRFPQKLFLHYGDMVDGGLWVRLLAQIRPDEIYNLAGLSHVGVSFALPEASAQINALGPLRILEAIRALGLPVRFYQASSSEMFGNAPAPQNEDTPFAPCSPYAAAKLYAYWLVKSYRDSYGLHASNGILFNHESPRRGEEFVTRKITRTLTAILAGEDVVLRLGNLEARRDWGHARDYVEGMWRMLQQPDSDDYVLATGETRSVRDFVMAAFAYAGIDLLWRGHGAGETALCRRSGRVLVAVDPALFRPADIHCLCGDASKARRVLGWQPQHDFMTLVGDMVDADRAALLSHVNPEQSDARVAA